MKIFKGDEVYITTGKSRGKKGKVVKVLPQKNQIVVNGINIVKKHLKPSAQNPKSGIIDLTKPINISNAEIICPKCQKTTRIEMKNSADKKVRICKKCKEVIDYAS